MTRPTRGVLRLATRSENAFQIRRAKWTYHSTAAMVMSAFSFAAALAALATDSLTAGAVFLFVAAITAIHCARQRFSAPLLWLSRPPFGAEAGGSIEMNRQPERRFRLSLVSRGNETPCVIEAVHQRGAATIVRFKLLVEERSELVLTSENGDQIARFDLEQ